MTSTRTLGLIAAWFLPGMTRIVFTSKLTEHRIDNPDPGTALAANPKAASARLEVANYDLPGRRLLPWYRVVSSTYWIVAATGLLWIILHG